MKRMLAIFAALSLILVQNVIPVYALDTHTVQVYNATEFMDALRSTSIQSIEVMNDLVLDFADAAHPSDQFIAVNSEKEIEGNGKTISFSGTMSHVYSSVFQFRKNVTLKNLTLKAPNKVHATDPAKDAYTPTVLSFYGENLNVLVKNVSVKTADITNNPQVAINVSTANSTVVFDQLYLDGGRLFFDGAAAGTVTLKDSVLSQAGVLFKETNGSDEIITFKGNTQENITLVSDNTTLYADRESMPADYKADLERLVANDAKLRLVDISDAVPTSLSAVSVYTGTGFVNALEDPSVNSVSLQNDVVIDYAASKNSTRSLVDVNHPLLIDGKNHQVSFATSVMPHTDTSVFNFSHDTTIKNLTMYAPNKTNVSEQKYEYTPTVFSFSGTDAGVHLKNVTLHVARGSQNPQVAIYMSTSGTSELIFDGLTVPSGRLYVSEGSQGSLTLKNVFISQASVTIKDADQSDEILNLKSTNFTVTGDNASFAVRPTHTPTRAYLATFLIDFARNNGIDLKYAVDEDVSVPHSRATLNLGDAVTQAGLKEQLGYSSLTSGLVWGELQISSENLDGLNIDTRQEAVFEVSVDLQFVHNGVEHIIKTYVFEISIVDHRSSVPVDTDDAVKDVLDVDKIEVVFDEEQFAAPVSQFRFGLPTLTERTKEAYLEQMSAILGDAFEPSNIFVLSISPLDADGNKLQLKNGFVEITVPVPEGLDVSGHFAVFHVGEAGVLERLEHTVVDGLITFKATAFSDFIIANIEPVDESDGPSGLPDAGIEGYTDYGYLMAGAGFFALTLGMRKSRKTAQKK